MSEIEYMKECMARDLVVMLVDEQKMSLHGALDAVYVYGFLRKEILTGKM